MPEIGEDPTLERIYDALDAGRYEDALDLAAAAIEDLPDEEDDPVLRFLAGIALLEMDQPGDAADQLSRAVEIDPEDAEFRSNLALALFRSCRFREAEDHARKALECDADSPDALFATALVLERAGRLDEADRRLERAARLDPDRFPVPSRLPLAAFENEIRRAAEGLPEDFRRHLRDVAVLVEELPSEGILLEERPPLDPELLGLFVGTALPDRSFSGPVAEPPRILLFKRNIERYAQDEADLRRQIAVTLFHELGHYLGLDEEGLENIDLG